MTEHGQIYGAIEAGGTKFVCAVARDVDEILEERRIDTRRPQETLADVARFFEQAQRKYGELHALGVGSFGPIRVDRSASDWGHLLSTPKPGWTGADLVGALTERLHCPIELDTDVNAAALAESMLGAGQGRGAVAYVTVGTGIGAGVVIDGRPLHGRLHPEMGHLQVRRDARDLTFPGSCPFHGDCLEGVAGGLSILRRWGSELSALPEEHVAYSVIGGYLGQLASIITLVVSAECIAFGGGVLSNGLLLPHIRASMRDSLAGYLPASDLEGDPDAIVCASALAGRAGLLGALLLAQRAGARDVALPLA